MGKVKIDKAALDRALRGISDAASERAANRLRDRIRREIIASGRMDTGEMWQKIDVVNVPDGPKEGRWAVRPRTKQFVFQNWGTRGTPYKKGRVLRFKPKGSGVFIFRMSTGPITPAHFLRKAVRRMNATDWGE